MPTHYKIIQLVLAIISLNVFSIKASAQDKNLKSEQNATDSVDLVDDLNLGSTASQDIRKNKEDDVVFRMQEHDTNYLIMGKPDTKVQFSFKFKFMKKAPIYMGYTQIMFWELLRKDSNPFSELNFNPELYYKFDVGNSLLNEIDVGHMHLSNGEDGEESRSIEMAFLRLTTQVKSKYGIPRLQLIFRYLFGADETNPDINDYYGPFVMRLYFDRIGYKLFQSEQFYLEYYNGGIVANEYSRNSIRLSARFKIFASAVSPKLFIQYFNGFGENLSNYNQRDETYRIGFSVGGQ